MDFKYNVGDRVIVVRSGKGLEDCYGGWNKAMELYVNDGETYIVTDRFQHIYCGAPGYCITGCDIAQSGIERWAWDERLLELPEQMASEMSVADLMRGSV